jgi:caa(3)-type oxidase subunit IV
MKLLFIGRRFQGLASDDKYNQVQLMTMSAVDFLDQWFETDVLKATMSASGIIGTFLGVRSPGTAYVLLHHYMGEIDGAFRAWGFARGGTGAISNAIAGAAREAGSAERANRGDHGTLLALRRRGVDRDLHRRLPDSVGERMSEQAHAQAHATTGTYLRVAAILVMITIIEVGIFYVPTFQSVLVPVLLFLSAVKFTLVVMFYMHLKFDNRFFTFLFGGPLLLALAVVISLLFIFYGAVRLRTGM